MATANGCSAFREGRGGQGPGFKNKLSQSDNWKSMKRDNLCDDTASPGAGWRRRRPCGCTQRLHSAADARSFYKLRRTSVLIESSDQYTGPAQRFPSPRWHARVASGRSAGEDCKGTAQFQSWSSRREPRSTCKYQFALGSLCSTAIVCLQ